MTFKSLDTKIRAFEDGASASGKIVTDRADLASKLDAPGDLLIIIDALPDPETFVAMASAMPDIPPLSDVLRAFLPDAADFAEFVTTTPDGNLDVLAALAADGCDPAPDKLKRLATEFAGTPQPKEMLDEGGLGNHPAAMAAMVGAMDVGAFKNVCDKFDSDINRMAALMGAFRSHDTGISDANLVKKLKDPSLDQIETLNVAAKAPTVGGGCWERQHP